MHRVDNEILIKIDHIPRLILDSNRTLWLPEQKTLVISDLHIGKVQHFRKHGIPLPLIAATKNIELLKNAIQKRNPSRIILLGDLFHSYYNSEWKFFEDALREVQIQSKFEIILTVGNHDILPKHLYDAVEINSFPNFELDGIYFTHEPPEIELPEKSLVVCGHLHPGVTVVGKAKNKLKFPCFGFSDNRLYMPSFGNLTGSVSIDWSDKAKIYAIVDPQRILEINPIHRKK